MAIVVICALLFGKIDTKKTLLNEVGLDFSKKTYENAKEKEFEKYCKKALYNAITDYNVTGINENKFLENLSYLFSDAMYGDSNYNFPYLGVSKHYISHLLTIIYRRQNELKDKETSPLLQSCDFTQKSDTKRYVLILWEKYQYPWPQDWLKKDGI